MAEGGDGQDICTFLASFIDQRLQAIQLLEWLRESQTTCTDTHCYDSISGFPGTEQGGAVLPGTQIDHDCQEPLDQNPLALVLLIVFSVLTLYAMNLNRDQRQPVEQPSKNSSSSQEDTHDHDQFRRGGDDDDGQNRPSL